MKTHFFLEHTNYAFIVQSHPIVTDLLRASASREFIEFSENVLAIRSRQSVLGPVDENIETACRRTMKAIENLRAYVGKQWKNLHLEVKFSRAQTFYADSEIKFKVTSPEANALASALADADFLISMAADARERGIIRESAHAHIESQVRRTIRDVVRASRGARSFIQSRTS